MCDEWMPTFRVALSPDEFHRLPRNAAYTYERIGGTTIISPSPRTRHATLDLASCSFVPEDLAPAEEYEIVPALSTDRETLAKLFSGAFSQTQPFASLSDDARLSAADECLRRTFDGEDGPWMADASFVMRWRASGDVVGAVLVTLIPDGDPDDFSTYRWKENPPGNILRNGRGQPHLTWIFTHHFYKGDGIGTSLLASAVHALRADGRPRLLSTFIAGNDSSMLWHWRNGFKLEPYFASKRRVRTRFKP